MEVEMENRLLGVCPTRVQQVHAGRARLRNEALRDAAGGQHYGREGCLFDVEEVLKMRLRNHKRVRARDLLERDNAERQLVLIDHGRRPLALHDSAEHASVHALTLSLERCSMPVPAVCSR